VDVDEEQELASQWNNGGIPFFVFYYNGQQVHLYSQKFLTVDGGIEGGINKQQMINVCNQILKEVQIGNYQVNL